MRLFDQLRRFIFFLQDSTCYFKLWMFFVQFCPRQKQRWMCLIFIFPKYFEKQLEVFFLIFLVKKQHRQRRRPEVLTVFIDIEAKPQLCSTNEERWLTAATDQTRPPPSNITKPLNEWLHLWISAAVKKRQLSCFLLTTAFEHHVMREKRHFRSKRLVSQEEAEEAKLMWTRSSRCSRAHWRVMQGVANGNTRNGATQPLSNDIKSSP